MYKHLKIIDWYFNGNIIYYISFLDNDELINLSELLDITIVINITDGSIANVISRNPNISPFIKLQHFMFFIPCIRR